MMWWVELRRVFFGSQPPTAGSAAAANAAARGAHALARRALARGLCPRHRPPAPPGDRLPRPGRQPPPPPAPGPAGQPDRVIDCRGLGAKPQWPALRGVRGEVARVHAPDVTLQRPTRLV